MTSAADPFVECCESAPSFARQARILKQVLTTPGVHALFLNTLSRLEYVGVRKLLKSRRSETLDSEGLQHILEEAVHATRLKKFARAIAPDPAAIATFSEEHTLAGDAAERYFQSVDAAAAESLGTRDSELCYLLTSTAIEVRAKVFYPAYQAALSNAGSPISVRSIVSDEESHLDQMVKQLFEQLNSAEQVLTQVLRAEESGFNAFLDAVEARLTQLVQ